MLGNDSFHVIADPHFDDFTDKAQVKGYIMCQNDPDNKPGVYMLCEDCVKGHRELFDSCPAIKFDFSKFEYLFTDDKDEFVQQMKDLLETVR